MAELRLRLLGGLSIEAVAGRSIRLVSMKAQALLAYLAVSSEKTHRREHLAALLWGDVTEAQARDSLRHVVLALRKALVTAKVTGFGAEAQAVWLDKRALTSDIAALERALQSRDPRGRARAATLYRGDLLAGFTSGAGAGEIARQLLALDPARESAHRGLMKALAAEGRVTDALAQYRACVAIVKRELGIQPSAETGTLYDEIARAGTATDRASRADVATMPFVGRRDELTRLQSAMREGLRGRGRFALVLGEAGMGKSRVLEAVLAEARREGALALVGRCREGGAASPLAPWSEIARAPIAALPGHEAEAAQARAAQIFPELGARAKPPCASTAPACCSRPCAAGSATSRKSSRCWSRSRTCTGATTPASGSSPHSRGGSATSA